ncbi:MAG: hypothetical protein ABF289_08750 [Clostridiales bacterium]
MSLKQKMIIILGIILMVAIIAFDIFYKGKDNNDSGQQFDKNTDLKPTETPIVENIASDNLKTDDKKEIIEKEDRMYQSMVRDLVEAEIFAAQGKMDALGNLVDLKSDYGETKINEINSLKTKGITKTFKYLDRDKVERSKDSVKIYVKLYMGKINKSGQVFKEEEFKKFYIIKKVSEYSFQFIGEGTW